MILTGNISKKQLKAIHWFAQQLFSTQLSQHLHIKVSYKKVDTHWGLTIIDDYNQRGYPRHFTLEVNRSLSEHEKLMTLAHEMVHVRQYAKMELNEEMNRWHGEYVNTDLIPYHEQPWEIEAYDLGDRLFKQYQKL
jgi:predicted nucleotidyltransferase component of viral defense system